MSEHANERADLAVPPFDFDRRSQPAGQSDRLFEQSMALLCIVGFDGYMKHWNPAWNGVFGYTSQEMLALPLDSLVHPLDQPRLAALREQLLAPQAVSSDEIRIRCKNGTFKWILWNAAPCVERRVFFATGQDITALKDTQEKLRDSEERFRLVARATSDAIWDWDIEKNQVWRSEGFQTWFGYRREDLSADLSWWQERVHENDRGRTLAQLPAANLSKTDTYDCEYRFRRADGTYADVHDRGFVMFAVDGTPKRMVGSLTDVTERRLAEQVVHRQQAELAHIARLSTLGEIATGLAHELNQPLTAIANYAQSCTQAMASQAPDWQEQVRGWVDKIASNTHRAGEMIRRLRGFARKSETRRSIVEMNELIQEVIDLLEAETRLHDVRLLCPPSELARVSADRVQIQQVLVNLLRNAYEAMSAAPSQQRQVAIALAGDGRQVLVSVEDQGEGIATDIQERIFEAFFTNKPQGLGVGLAISRSIVEDHGGRLWFTPNPKRGVTFHFTLPLVEAHDG